MAEEIARLGVAVDSTSAVSASKDLETLAVAGDKATASAKNLKSGWASMTLTPTQLYSANQGLNQFKGQLAQAAQASANLNQAWKKQTFNNTQMMRANQSLAQFKTQLQQAAQASNQLAAANKVQAASHHQVAKAAVGYTKSAKEMAFATRNLPAQFTDIAVSLQAGQNPLTVLLQQGGQLKDMFGGVGPAARAMGGYIAGLVNPFTVAAVAVTALAVAWIKGDAEARKFNATLEMQGNTLGVTTGDLMSAASGMERFGQSQGAAAAALNATAASGKIFGDSIQTVAQAALNLEREGGQAIEDTVKDFASLAGEPVSAALKLDEQYKFLTVSTYEQIRALEDQGDKMGAAQVAMDALADTINQRTSNINENLGTLEKTWRLVANAAKWAWDQMLNIGRETSVEDQIINLNEEIGKLRNPTLGGDYSLMTKGARDRRIKEFQDEIRALQPILRAETAKAEQEFLQEQARVASISLAEQARAGRSNAEKRVTERKVIEADVTKAIKGIVAKSEEDRVAQETVIRQNGAAAIAAMEKRLADPKARKTPKSQEAKDAERLLRQRAQEYESLSRSLDQHEETLTAAGDAQERLSAFEKTAIKILSDLDNGHSKLDEAQKAEMRTRIEALRVIDQGNQARDKQNKIMEVSADLQRRIADAEAAQSQGHRDELRGIGRGQNEAALEQALEDIRLATMREKTDLEERYQKLRAVGSDQYLKDLKDIEDAEARMMNAEISQLERRKAAMSDWRNGARSALEDILWDMNDVAGRTRDGFLNAFSSMNNALSNFAQTGKLKIRDFATTVIAELLRIALTIATTKALTSMFGATKMFGAGSAQESAAYDNWFQNNSAKGNVMSGGNLVPFANGGVRTSPTLIPMANGDRMLMAEERPEAIMPLMRGPNGKLGVQATGGGGGVTNVNTNVTIMTDGSSQSNTTVQGDQQNTAKLIGALVEKKVTEALVEHRRQGGLLWAMQQGR